MKRTRRRGGGYLACSGELGKGGVGGGGGGVTVHMRLLYSEVQHMSGVCCMCVGPITTHFNRDESVLLLLKR